MIRLDLPGLHEFFVEHASETQLSFLPPTAIHEAQFVTGRIRISAESDTRSMSQVDPERQALFERDREPSVRRVGSLVGSLTQFPTAAYASDARR